MAKTKNLISSETEYTLSYSGMKGVNFSAQGAKKDRYRFSHLENMYKNYECGGDGTVESVPGFRKLYSFPDKIHSIFSHKGDDGLDYIVVHSGTSLYRFPADERDSLSDLVPIKTVKDTKTRAFSFDGDLFILDGENITRVASDGTATTVGTSSDKAYVPTTFINGIEFEQRNLFSDYFMETYRMSFADEHFYGNPELTYQILSPNEKTCAVTGITRLEGRIIHIPSYVEIHGEKYTVTEISDNAFLKTYYLTEVYISPKVTRIGKNAFHKCYDLIKVSTGDATETICASAFAECSSLATVYLGARLSTIEAGAFSGCPLSNVYYTLYADDFAAITGKEEIGSVTPSYGVRNQYAKLSVPVFSAASMIRGFSLDGENYDFETYGENNVVDIISFETTNKDYYTNKVFNIWGELSRLVATKNSSGKDFLTMQGDKLDGISAIKGCTVCECYDGRVFLSGNPSLPNTVFYSSRNMTGKCDPTYFGIFNFFNDGVGSFKVKSLLTAGESLAVFKEGDDGSGSIFYHTPKETGIDILPKIYPVSYIHSGISALGESISFFDDPVFISALGVCALDKKNLNLERSVVCRSHNINQKLLFDDPSKISLAKWCGYLVVAAGEHIYLADSRSPYMNSDGSMEYEWYYLSGIGTYDADHPVYRYASTRVAVTKLHPNIDGKLDANAKVGTFIFNGDKYFFTGNSIIDSYHVTKTMEMQGGTFSPSSCIHACTDTNLLFFGTESGDVCVFNNDKRGVPPPYIAESKDFDGKEYKKHMGSSIHPYYYSYNNRPVRYAAKTTLDDCDIPHLSKNTVKNSLCVKIKNFGRGKLTIEAGTDKKGFSEILTLPDSGLCFGDLDFSSLSFINTDYITLPIAEKEKGWVEKELNFYTDEFCSPFGICSATYRYTINGKIKKA